jgi:UDP-4-amino-4,6-dideoxy-N-acetyl-beta-L-altrosamine transaminase
MSTAPFLSYGRQAIDDDDIAAVVDVLRGDMLTTGPMVDRFEAALAMQVGAQDAVVCNSGTAALYLAARAAGIGEGDTVVVPAITFVATASANVLAGADVVFADVDPETGLMEAEHLEAALASASASSGRVKAVLPVHLGGRVADLATLQALAAKHGAVIIEDACHALGTTYGSGTAVGACQDGLAACFSFHPVKTIAMGEGGAMTTNSPELAAAARRLRNHGMERRADTIENRALGFDGNGEANPWYYEVAEISHNLRASDINCALALSQLHKLDRFVEHRRALMARYAAKLEDFAPYVRLIAPAPGVEPGWHLCGVLIDFEAIAVTRRELMMRLSKRGIGSQVHYIPVNLQPFYRRKGAGDLPGARSYYSRALSLPLFAGMTLGDVDRVVEALNESLAT